MKFIADVMLGKLAKHMRLLGLDVLYSPALADNEIIRLSLEQHRIILTRDAGLTKRPLAANHLFISSEKVHDQLRQIWDTFPIDSAASPLTRCSICNSPLVIVSRDEARDLVPQQVYDRFDCFVQCQECNRTYWKGSHVRRMMTNKDDG